MNTAFRVLNDTSLICRDNPRRPLPKHWPRLETATAAVLRWLSSMHGSASSGSGLFHRIVALALRARTAWNASRPARGSEVGSHCMLQQTRRRHCPGLADDMGRVDCQRRGCPWAFVRFSALPALSLSRCIWVYLSLCLHKQACMCFPSLADSYRVLSASLSSFRT